MSITIIRGTVVSAPAPGKLDVTERGFLIAEGGRIAGVYPVLPEQYAGAPVEDYGDALILQAPVDLHLHAPQYPLTGVGLDLPLLEWLNAYAFPTEARFADPDYAREIYRPFAEELIRHGTTRVCVFSSLHRPATRVLMEELERAGVMGYAGKVNMDRNSAPGILEETTEESKRETLRWLEECGDFRGIRPILTPRFTPACTDELLAFLGKLSEERNLPVQSHLSESRAEIAWVRELCPGCGQYWETYARSGLWHDRTVMAHCVWSDERERAAMREHGVTAVHCPSSNRNLCSGTAPARRMLDEGVRMALGTDIAAGDQVSMFDAAADAVRASKTRHLEDGSAFLTGTEAWYLAVSGGGMFFGDRPGFAPGNPLHALVLADEKLPCPHPLTVAERLERSLYRRQKDAIRAVWSGENQVFPRV